MRGLQLALIYANWAGSLCFGWLHVVPWLLVPIAVWSSFAFGATAAIAKHQKESGIDTRYAKLMFVPNVKLIARNAGINFILFAVAWAASLFAGIKT